MHLLLKDKITKKRYTDKLYNFTKIIQWAGGMGRNLTEVV